MIVSHFLDYIEPEIARLNAEDQVNLYYTSVSVNLLTLRPEICLLLLVTDPAWGTRAAKRATESCPTAVGPCATAGRSSSTSETCPATVS
jgi:hypothetical protein